MENIYVYLTPIALSLLGIEILIHLFGSKNLFSFEETITNIGTAIVNQLMNLAVLALVLLSYGHLYENYALFKIELTWLSGLILLIAVDFLFYWFHRFGHKINILWAAHEPHHSAEEMNLGVGLRASVTQRLFSFISFWPLALIGYEPIHIYTMTGIHLILGYWHHTKAIGQMGWFEKYFNTPSYHRVHHGVNPQYIDKNFAEFLIIWDKLFGTYAKEEEEVVYGVKHQPKSYNPFFINFNYYIFLWKRAQRLDHWWEKIQIWFMPTTWKAEKTITFDRKGNGFEKFIKKVDPYFRPYLILDLILCLSLMVTAINLKIELPWMMRAIFIAIIIAKTLSWGAILESKVWGIFCGLFTHTIQIIALITLYQQSIFYTQADTRFFIEVFLGVILLTYLLFTFGRKSLYRSMELKPGLSR